MMNAALDRRKFVAISAAAAGLSALPFGARNNASAGHLVEWRGTCLGAVATLRIHHNDQSRAEDLVRQAVAEERRLEALFSLYREDSVLCQLNRHGVLASPPSELSELLFACNHYWEITGGMFDPTVQALWRCYAESFSSKGKAPTAAEREAALELAGWRHVRFDRDRVVLARAGMGLTLNGIAQGYITDRVLVQLRSSGIESCLVDMGEIRTLGEKQDGHPWSVSIEDAFGKPWPQFPLSIRLWRPPAPIDSGSTHKGNAITCLTQGQVYALRPREQSQSCRIRRRAPMRSRRPSRLCGMIWSAQHLACCQGRKPIVWRQGIWGRSSQIEARECGTALGGKISR